MINGSGNERDIDSEEVTLDAEGTSEEDPLDTVSRIVKKLRSQNC